MRTNRAVNNHKGSTPDGLSIREREVLTQIAEGLSNREIACLLKVGIATVKTHRDHVMLKLNVHTIAGLRRFAFARGFISLRSQSPEQALAPG
jgi:DNA-binding CsgD family transcriptional regulator